MHRLDVTLPVWQAWEEGQCQRGLRGRGRPRGAPAAPSAGGQPFRGRRGPAWAQRSAAPAPGGIKSECQRNGAAAEVRAEEACAVPARPQSRQRGGGAGRERLVRKAGGWAQAG